MSPSVDFGDVDRFTAGAIGPTGRRTFLIQAVKDNTTLTLKVEKQQVAVLAEYLGRLLVDVERPGHLPSDLDLVEPTDPHWAVGTVGVSYEDIIDRVVILVDELVPEDEPGDTARMTLTREQAAAFAIKATELVEAGRPPCPLCGFPIDPSGHECPRTNGHRPPAT